MLPALQALITALPWLRVLGRAALRALLLAALAPGAQSATEPPARLSDTGLQGPGVAGFSPQYPLWSDGAEKRRWIVLPRGQAIDASNPDAWQFPRGTRLWKEFAVDGRPVETRYIERRADGSWLFASYVWNEAGTEALLAPERGIAALPVRGAPNGVYTVPGRGDCLACHGGAPVPVLGFSALQLSPDRDPQAANARAARPGDVDLPALVARGWLRGLPKALLARPPRIDAASSTERAALGTLHANCGHCHHGGAGRVPVDLTLAQRVAVSTRAEVLASAVGAASRYQPPGTSEALPVIAPGAAPSSVLVRRMSSRHPQVQMPPLGTQVPDPEGLALIERWISHDLSHHKEP